MTEILAVACLVLTSAHWQLCLEVRLILHFGDSNSTRVLPHRPLSTTGYYLGIHVSNRMPCPILLIYPSPSTRPLSHSPTSPPHLLPQPEYDRSKHPLPQADSLSTSYVYLYRAHR